MYLNLSVSLECVFFMILKREDHIENWANIHVKYLVILCEFFTGVWYTKFLASVVKYQEKSIYLKNKETII